MADRPSPAHTASTESVRIIDGPALARAFRAGAEALRQQADAINAINVFPVPDGDTGTNMSLTMRAAVEALSEAASAREVAAAAARGALMGAKGNSGVILSQILGGIAAMPDGTDELDASALAVALARARDAAYRVVSVPKEGTILTAINDAAAAASNALESAAEAMRAAADAARAAVERSPELLPVLKEAGVVDSGAQGLYVLLDSMARSLRGEDAAPVASTLGAIDPSWLSATQQVHQHGGGSGFCTEFVVEGDALNADAMRVHLRTMGDSVLVVGGGSVARVHLHTQSPDDAFAYARSLGAVSREKADDMEAQFRALASRSSGQTAAGSTAAALAVVSVAAGEGIAELMRSMGAIVVRGGQTMNPSAGEIAKAVADANASDVIVLPNNKNIVLAAQQAQQLTGEAVRVHVVATTTLPQGVSALVAFNAELDAMANVETMASAIDAVSSAEVTLAARQTTVGGVSVRAGQPIGIIDGELAVAGDSVDDVVCACVERMAGADGALVTLYTGEGVEDAGAQALASRLRDAFGVEVDVVDGGQPHYPYVMGVE